MPVAFEIRAHTKVWNTEGGRVYPPGPLRDTGVGGLVVRKHRSCPEPEQEAKR
jgi:hypothetical protein